MPTFRMSRLPEAESRVDRLASALSRFELQPSYQRQSDVWGEEKRQLFIDSLLNGYDVPKLYFHRLPRAKTPAPVFAIVDGKQRLEAIRAFLKNEFALSQDFVDVEGESETTASLAGGKTFTELTQQHPALAGRLMDRGLDVVVIETPDLEIIEELFSRLNEAVPLNAPEKRNAFGGAMPPIIRRLVRSHSFFVDRLPIENTRYRQYDLVTKFLFLTEKNGFAATKKRALDDFVRSYRDDSGGAKKKTEADHLAKRTSAVLDAMSSTFESQDELLTSVGLVTVYYMAFLFATTDQALRTKLTHDQLVAFDHVRRQNRLLLRKEQAAIASGHSPKRGLSIRRDLAIFDRLMQSPNDGQALEYRFRILRAFLERKQFRDALPAGLKHRMGEE
jgi:hypothetical protein